MKAVSLKPPPHRNTLHVRQVRFGGGGGGGGDNVGGARKRNSLATAVASSSSSFVRDQVTSPTPSVHFQVHPAPRSPSKKG